ncbi:MAG TPA: coenzyme F420-0:L-glutamate ligase [Marmoricola sp.]|nr:coenzyme F420-0:L-glutamate ligase [Marmoricola sp.]
MTRSPASFQVTAVPGIGEVATGADLAALVAEHADLRDGDVVVVTSKVVSKAEGRVVRVTRDEAVAAETDRVVARRGATSIVRTRHGFVMAAAGVDASNTPPGTVVLLPEDPDGSARRLRSRLREVAGVTVGVVVTDTSGRAWRNGQTDIAVGAAGLLVLDDHAGRVDGYGNQLAVTAPALADEVAGAADLAKGKLGGTPVAVVRGLEALVLDAEDDGPGASALVRDEAGDMFGLGAREAVLAAVDAGADLRGFGAPAAADVVVAALVTVVGAAAGVAADGGGVAVRFAPGLDPRAAGRLEARVEAVLKAHAWDTRTTARGISARPGTP